VRPTRTLAAAALAGLTLLAYSNALTGGFVLDSRVLILEDPRLRALSVQNLSDIFTRSYWWPYTPSNLYRPLTTLSYLVNYTVLGNGTNPFGYHLVNIALHLVNVLLVYFLARRFCDGSDADATSPGSDRHAWLALLLAAAWAVHPLSTEAVTYIMGRADLLAAMSVLGGFLSYLRAARDPRRIHWGWFALTLAIETAGMFAKESAVVLPAIIVLYELLVRRGEGDEVTDAPRPRGKKLSRVHAPQQTSPAAVSVWLALLLAPIAAFLVQRQSAIATSLPPEPFVDNPIAHAGFLQGPLTALAVIGRYLWLAAVPLKLSSDYSYVQVPLADGRLIDWFAWATVAVIAAVAVIAIVRRERLLAFALGSALITFLPTSNLLFPTGTIMAERLLYLPLVGLTGALVLAADRAADRIRTHAAAFAVLATIVVLFGARTWVRNRDWRDDVTLWTSAVKASPNSFKAHKGLADALYDANPSNPDWKRITSEADRSIAILDSVPDTMSVPAAYRRAIGFFLDWGDALRESNDASADTARAAYARSVVLAERHLAVVQALSREPGSPNATSAMLADAHALLATAYRRAGDTQKSLDAARQALLAQPLNPTAYRTLAASLTLARQYDTAAVALLTGFMVTGDADLRQALVDVYRAGLDTEGCAVKQGPSGVVLNPACAIVHRHLCVANNEAIRVQRQLGRTDLVQQLEMTGASIYGCAAPSDAPSGK